MSEADGKAIRYNESKPRPTLFPVICYIHIIEILEFGAKKYSDNNWKKGLTYKSCLDSLERHLIKFKLGEDRDKESGFLHIGHVIVNAIFIMYFILTGRTDLDDREEK